MPNAYCQSIIFLSCIVLSQNVTTAQNSASPERTNHEPVSSIPTLYWSKDRDIRKWLKENDAALNRGDACTLSYSWAEADDSKAPSGSVSEIVSFVTTPEDEEMTRLISGPEGSGIEVRLGIRYVRAESQPNWTQL